MASIRLGLGAKVHISTWSEAVRPPLRVTSLVQSENLMLGSFGSIGAGGGVSWVLGGGDVKIHSVSCITLGQHFITT